MQSFLLLSELGLLGRTCTFAVLSGSVRTTIIAIHNTIHITHGTAAVGLIPGLHTVMVTACATCIAPEVSLGLTVTRKIIIPAARLTRVATPVAPAPGLVVLPLAFPLFLFLGTVRVFVGASRITLLLTLLGRIRLSVAIAVAVVVAVPVPPALPGIIIIIIIIIIIAFLLVHLIR